MGPGALLAMDLSSTLSRDVHHSPGDTSTESRGLHPQYYPPFDIRAKFIVVEERFPRKPSVLPRRVVQFSSCAEG
jgi:hypothetical protein